MNFTCRRSECFYRLALIYMNMWMWRPLLYHWLAGELKVMCLWIFKDLYDACTLWQQAVVGCLEVSNHWSVIKNSVICASAKSIVGFSFIQRKFEICSLELSVKCNDDSKYIICIGSSYYLCVMTFSTYYNFLIISLLLKLRFSFCFFSCLECYMWLLYYIYIFIRMLCFIFIIL